MTVLTLNEFGPRTYRVGGIEFRRGEGSQVPDPKLAEYLMSLENKGNLMFDEDAPVKEKKTGIVIKKIFAEEVREKSKKVKVGQQTTKKAIENYVRSTFNVELDSRTSLKSMNEQAFALYTRALEGLEGDALIEGMRRVRFVSEKKEVPAKTSLVVKGEKEEVVQV